MEKSEKWSRATYLYVTVDVLANVKVKYPFLAHNALNKHFKLSENNLFDVKNLQDLMKTMSLSCMILEQTVITLIFMFA